MHSISVLVSRIFYFLKPMGSSVEPFGERGGRGRGGRAQVKGGTGRRRGRGGQLTPRYCLERWIMGRREIANLKPRTADDTRQPNLTNGSPEPPPPRSPAPAPWTDWYAEPIWLPLAVQIPQEPMGARRGRSHPAPGWAARGFPRSPRPRPPPLPLAAPGVVSASEVRAAMRAKVALGSALGA